jgi:hypothetical protein
MSMVIGILVPTLIIGPVMLWVAIISPMMVFSALTGKVDGEFYCEGMMTIAAIGLWMLLCLVFAVADFVGRPRVRMSDERLAGADSNQANLPRTINRLPKLPHLDPKHETPLR